MHEEASGDSVIEVSRERLLAEVVVFTPVE